MLQVSAMPIGDDASQLAPGVDAKPRASRPWSWCRSTGTPRPIACRSWTSRSRRRSANINQTVTFDASLTRDEGVVCGDRCTYSWDFGSDAKTRPGES